MFAFSSIHRAQFYKMAIKRFNLCERQIDGTFLIFYFSFVFFLFFFSFYFVGSFSVVFLMKYTSCWAHFIKLQGKRNVTFDFLGPIEMCTQIDAVQVQCNVRMKEMWCGANIPRAAILTQRKHTQSTHMIMFALTRETLSSKIDTRKTENLKRDKIEN